VRLRKGASGWERPHEINWKDFTTAKTRRARRNEALKKQENKSVQEIHPVFQAQLLTHLKLSGHRLGFLVNWNVARIKDGIQRMVNGI
jgi:hypothetical protein